MSSTLPSCRQAAATCAAVPSTRANPASCAAPATRQQTLLLAGRGAAARTPCTTPARRQAPASDQRHGGSLTAWTPRSACAEPSAPKQRSTWLSAASASAAQLAAQGAEAAPAASRHQSWTRAAQSPSLAQQHAADQPPVGASRSPPARGSRQTDVGLAGRIRILAALATHLSSHLRHDCTDKPHLGT